MTTFSIVFSKQKLRRHKKKNGQSREQPRLIILFLNVHNVNYDFFYVHHECIDLIFILF